MITSHVSLETFRALVKHWASERTARGKLARSYQAMLNGRESDLDGEGFFALIRFAGVEMGIEPNARFA